MKHERFSIRKTTRGAVSTCIAVLSFLSLASTAPVVLANDAGQELPSTEVVSTVPEEVLPEPMESLVPSAEEVPAEVPVAEEVPVTEEPVAEVVPAEVVVEETAPAEEAAVEEVVEVAAASAGDDKQEEEPSDVLVRYHAVDDDGQITVANLIPEKLVVQNAQEGDEYDTTSDDIRLESIEREGETYIRLDLTDNSSRSYTDGRLAESDNDDLYLPGDEKGTVTIGKITLVNYYYEKEARGDVLVRYLSEDGLVLQSDAYVIQGKRDGERYDATDYRFARLVLEDGRLYDFNRAEGASEVGTVSADEVKEIRYIYTEVKGNVFVEHISEASEVLIPATSVVTEASVGTAYSTSPETTITLSDGRVFVFAQLAEGSAPAVGQVTEGEQRVVYSYTEVKGNVTVEHRSDKGEVLIPATSVVAEASVGTAYSTSPETTITLSDGRVFVFAQLAEGSAPTVGQVTEGTQRVVYLYTEEVPVVPETPAKEETAPVVVDESYRGHLVTEQARLQEEMATLQAAITTAETLLQNQVQEGEVLSTQLTVLRDNLTQVSTRLAALDSQLQTIDGQLQTIDADLLARQSELETLKLNNPQGQLVSEINQLDAQLLTSQDRITTIDQLLVQKQAELASLQDEVALNTTVVQKETDLNTLKGQIAGLQAERETYRQTQQQQIDALKAQLATAGTASVTTTHPDKVVVTNGNFRGYSDTIWTNKGKQHEQVRFTGDRDVIVELTPAQEFETTGSFTYTVNEAKVEEYFYQYLAEIRANNGITIPLTKTVAASDYSQRRARENAAKDLLTHDTALADSAKGMYENAGYLYLGTYKSDQELAYQLAWQWFSDYSNIHGATGADGGYGHRNNLLSGSLVRYTDGSPAGVVQGDGLGIFENATSKKWHYLQNGYDYTLGFNYTDVAYSLDAQNNQSLTINGVTKPTVFMDALNFTYVIKGYTETTVNQAYVNLEQQIIQEERALTSRLAAFDTQIKTLENGTPSLLERETELATLKAALADLPAQRQLLTQEIQNLQNEQQTLTQEVSRLNQELTTKRSTLVVDQTTQRQQLLEQELQDLTSRKATLQAQQATLVAERQQLSGQQVTINQDITTLEQDLLAQENRRQTFEAMLNTSRRNQSELQTNLTTVGDKIDNIDNFDRRNRLGDPNRADVLLAAVGRLLLTDVNGTGVTVELNSDEGATVLKVIDHVEPTALNPEPIAQLAGLDYDLYDIILEDDQGNRVANLQSLAVVKLPIDEGKVVERVVYLPETGGLETLAILKQEAGFVYFEATHFSRYGVIYVQSPLSQPQALVTKPQQKSDGSSSTTVISAFAPSSEQQVVPQKIQEGELGDAMAKTLPKTGDTSSLLSLLGLGLTGLASLAFKRRRQ